VSPTVFRFKLREDVRWHDGRPFTADDVVYTIRWLTDPKTKIRFKAEFDWIKEARKIKPHVVEIESHKPYPAALMVLAIQAFILPQHIHEPLADKLVFGRKPVGTGMYKVVSFDPNRGVVLEKNRDYHYGGTAKPASNIGRVEIKQIPDQGTQVAELLAGNIDVVRNVPFAEGAAIAKADPRFEISISYSSSFYYMSLDALGRSGNKPLTDPRVRKALMMAIDREELKRVRTGQSVFDHNPKALCWDFQAGCSYNKTAPKFDPAGAKKLLAEAGYAGGFPVTISTFQSLRDYAEFVAGYLRNIGVKASVSPLTFAAYRKAQAEGQLEILVAGWNGGIGPDSGRTIAYFFRSSPRDYFGNAEIHKLAQQSLATTDEGKRKKLVSEVLDRSIDNAYVIALGGIPVPFLHRSDVKIGVGTIQPFALSFSKLNWK
jgi:peptide/nickel transport system substrate-binding protein